MLLFFFVLQFLPYAASCSNVRVGIFVVFLPAVFLSQKNLGSANRRDYWKVVTKGLPVVGKQSGPPTPLVWLVFSGHWTLFCYASFVMNLSAINSAQPARSFQRR